MICLRNTGRMPSNPGGPSEVNGQAFEIRQHGFEFSSALFSCVGAGAVEELDVINFFSQVSTTEGQRSCGCT